LPRGIHGSETASWRTRRAGDDGVSRSRRGPDPSRPSQQQHDADQRAEGCGDHDELLDDRSELLTAGVAAGGIGVHGPGRIQPAATKIVAVVAMPTRIPSATSTTTATIAPVTAPTTTAPASRVTADSGSV
jgi:hypothetical protein